MKRTSRRVAEHWDLDLDLDFWVCGMAVSWGSKYFVGDAETSDIGSSFVSMEGQQQSTLRYLVA